MRLKVCGSCCFLPSPFPPTSEYRNRGIDWRAEHAANRLGPERRPTCICLSHTLANSLRFPNAVSPHLRVGKCSLGSGRQRSVLVSQRGSHALEGYFFFSLSLSHFSSRTGRTNQRIRNTLFDSFGRVLLCDCHSDSKGDGAICSLAIVSRLMQEVEFNESKAQLGLKLSELSKSTTADLTSRVCLPSKIAHS